MADLTKNQIRARLKKIAELLEQGRDLLEELQSDTQQEADNVEPYEGKDDITPAQEERAEYLQDTADQLETITDDLADILAELDDLIY